MAVTQGLQPRGCRPAVVGSGRSSSSARRVLPGEAVARNVEGAHAVGRDASDDHRAAACRLHVAEAAARARLRAGEGRDATGKVVSLRGQDQVVRVVDGREGAGRADGGRPDGADGRTQDGGGVVVEGLKAKGRAVRESMGWGGRGCSEAAPCRAVDEGPSCRAARRAGLQRSGDMPRGGWREIQTAARQAASADAWLLHGGHGVSAATWRGCASSARAAVTMTELSLHSLPLSVALTILKSVVGIGVPSITIVPPKYLRPVTALSNRAR